MSTQHVTPADANIFEDLGIPREKAENLRIRSDLTIAILRIIHDRGLRQKHAAQLFGVSQPRISDLMRGKLDTFTIDALVNMLDRAGIVVDVRVGPAAETGRTAVSQPAAATG